MLVLSLLLLWILSCLFKELFLHLLQLLSLLFLLFCSSFFLLIFLIFLACFAPFLYLLRFKLTFPAMSFFAFESKSLLARMIVNLSFHGSDEVLDSFKEFLAVIAKAFLIKFVKLLSAANTVRLVVLFLPFQITLFHPFTLGMRIRKLIEWLRRLILKEIEIEIRSLFFIFWEVFDSLGRNLHGRCFLIELLIRAIVSGVRI
mmetsp:Transcript_478/g.534  ORF Transcript_478/g.534 Transcript_478/m.534 type:complete len:202 (-) Transcript_478:408-1013(-)